MFLVRLAVAGTLAIGAMSFAQQPYPSKPVRIVVPYAAAGGTDTVTRRVAQKITEQTGTSFFVENKAGATGTIGTAQVARSAPDGYTLLANDGTYSILPYVFKTLPWDYASDLVPITSTSVSPAMLIVSANSPFSNVAELVAYAKAHPGKLTYGTGGVGSSLHFATEAFAQAVGIQIRHIPFKGAGEAVANILSGTVDMNISGPNTALPLVNGGKVKALAVSGAKRMAALPNLATFREQGIPYEMSYWAGLAAPKGTPREVIDKVQHEVHMAMESQEIKTYFDSIGAGPGGMTPQDFEAFMQSDVARWKKVAAGAGIVPE